jgi:hypothetical protein
LDIGEICQTAAIACVIGVVSLGLLGVIFDASQAGFSLELVEAFFAAMAMSGAFAIVTVFPLGCAIGWLISRSGRRSALRAAIAGALTGAIRVALFYLVLAQTLPSDGPAYLFLGGMSVLGAVAGWSAFRIVFGRLPDPVAEAFTTVAGEA